MSGPAVLIIDDDLDIQEFIMSLLSGKGFRAVCARNAKEGLNQAREIRPSCIVIDWVMDQVSGLELTSTIRREPILKTVPILVMSGKRLDTDSLAEAIEAGADDFLTKPFSSVVFLSKVSAMVRRASWQDPASSPAEVIHFKNLTINCTARTASVNGTNLHLTYSEYELLVYLLRHKGIALDRPTLLRAVADRPNEVYHQVVDKHIENLRKKLGHLADHLETVRNIGYRFS